MRRALCQMVRGCCNLPHVGEHPGTAWLVGFILMGAAAGAKGGWFGAVGGAVFMAVFMGPIYLYGAYDRANYSDRLESDRAAAQQAAPQYSADSAGGGA